MDNQLRSKRIVIIGSSNIDFVMKMDRLPRLGETVTEAEYTQSYGGKGANQAVAAAHAGGEAYFVNCVGDDALSAKMVEGFREKGLNTDYVFTEKGISSGTALVMIDKNGDNYLSVSPGANYRLTPDRIEAIESFLKTAGIIVMQYEVPAETIQRVLKMAEAADVPVLWNFAPARNFPGNYIGKADILVVNETEAGFLADMEVCSPEDAEKAAAVIHKTGAPTVIVTLGKAGSLVSSKDEGVFSVPGFKVEAVDTTAAGDVYCGTLAVALSEGWSLKEAVLFASAASAVSVTRLGAQPSAPSRKEIEDFLEEHRKTE